MRRSRPFVALELSVALAAALASCAVATPVQRLSVGQSAFAGAVFPGETVALGKPSPGVEQFRVFQQGATGFVSIQAVRVGVQNSATQFCGRKGQAYRGVSETAALPPYIPGNFPRVELVFECVESPSLAQPVSVK